VENHKRLFFGFQFFDLFEVDTVLWECSFMMMMELAEMHGFGHFSSIEAP
jgi:hypothetical protein